MDIFNRITERIKSILTDNNIVEESQQHVVFTPEMLIYLRSVLEAVLAETNFAISRAGIDTSALLSITRDGSIDIDALLKQHRVDEDEFVEKIAQAISKKLATILRTP